MEIDGRDHFTEEGRLHDEARDRFTHSQGIRVLRFTGKQVELETEWVLVQIDQALSSPSQAPSIVDFDSACVISAGKRYRAPRLKLKEKTIGCDGLSGSLLPGATRLTLAANGRTRQERPTKSG